MTLNTTSEKQSKFPKVTLLLCLSSSHFAELLEKDEVSLLKLGRFLALGGPRKAGPSCSVGNHVALHQQLVVCNTTVVKPDAMTFCRQQRSLSLYLGWRGCWGLWWSLWRRADAAARSPCSCWSDWPARSIWELAAGVGPRRTSSSARWETDECQYKVLDYCQSWIYVRLLISTVNIKLTALWTASATGCAFVLFYWGVCAAVLIYLVYL